MNRDKLKKEGQDWVQEDIITEKQLDAILEKYTKNDQSYLLVLFAVLLMSIGILIFIFSDWAQMPNVFRIVVMLLSMLVLYFSGHHFYIQSLVDSTSSKNGHVNQPARIYGIGFIVLGYIFFGATLFLILNMYHVTILNVWPFVIWSLVGLLLYMTYEHPLLFVLGIVINVYAQLYSVLEFSSFNIILFILLLLGYLYHAYRKDHVLLSYFFTIGLSIHILTAAMTEFDQYYWYMFFVLLVYALGVIVPKSSLKHALTYISLLSILMFKVYESFLIQESDFLQDIDMQSLFFIALGILWVGVFLSKWLSNRHLDMMDLILFLPLFILPYAYVWVIISMFIFSLFWLVIGFQRQWDNQIRIGIITFIISIFTVYIQYAWETLNKSLFFLIGGLLLFFLSFILERKRRTTEHNQEEHDI